MPLARTNGVSAIVARARTRDNQRPWPARYATYWSDAHAERKIQTWKGLATAKGVRECEDPLVSGRCHVAVVTTSSPSNGDPRFRGDGGMVTVNPYGDTFCHTFGRLFDVWS